MHPDSCHCHVCMLLMHRHSVCCWLCVCVVIAACHCCDHQYDSTWLFERCWLSFWCISWFIQCCCIGSTTLVVCHCCRCHCGSTFRLSKPARTPKAGRPVQKPPAPVRSWNSRTEESPASAVEPRLQTNRAENTSNTPIVLGPSEWVDRRPSREDDRRAATSIGLISRMGREVSCGTLGHSSCNINRIQWSFSRACDARV